MKAGSSLVIPSSVLSATQPRALPFLAEAYDLLGNEPASTRAASCGTQRDGFPFRCFDRFDRHCSVSKKKRLAKKVWPLIDLDRPHSFATMIWQDVPEIRPEHILAQRAALTKLKRHPCMSKVRGTVGVMEVSYHKDQVRPFRVHAHLIVEGRFQTEQWHKATPALREGWVASGGSDDVKIVPLDFREAIDIRIGYIVKGLSPEMPTQAAAEIIQAFGSTASQFRWGSLRSKN